MRTSSTHSAEERAVALDRFEIEIGTAEMRAEIAMRIAEHGIEAIVQGAIDAFGQVDILVVASGMNAPAPISTTWSRSRPRE